MRVLFRVAVGPRLGFGHLVRCRSLARALGVTPTVSVRGSRATRDAAVARGFTLSLGGVSVLSGPDRPDVLIVDDPSTTQAARWVKKAKRLGIPTATLHDLGLGYVESDLSIDGSIAPGEALAASGLSGPTYAALDPTIAIAREHPVSPRYGVLIALGGGRHVHTSGAALARAILQRNPDVRIRIVAGFAGPGHVRLKPNATSAQPDAASAGVHGTDVEAGFSRPDDDPRVTWVCAPEGLAEELRQAAVAVVAGGLTIYEAAALGTPVVGLAVVPAQQSTISAFARRGAAIDAGSVSDASAFKHVADAVADLLSHPSRATSLGSAAARLVDGRGVFRAADAIRQLTQRLEGQIHAA